MELIPSHQKTGNAWRKIKPHKHHKHPSQAWYMTSIRLHHAGSLWWRSSMGLHGSATCCKFIEASNWSICQARNATFSDILSILSWFGGSFSVGECAFGVRHQIRTSWREIRNNRQSVRSAAVLVVSAPALFVLFAELFASRRETKKTKQHRATIGQFRRNGVSELWRCLLAPPCFVYPRHPTAITATTATTAMFATSKCMPINCWTQSGVKSSENWGKSKYIKIKPVIMDFQRILMSILPTASGLWGLCKRILESTALSAFAAGASNTLAERTAVSGCLTSLSKTLHSLERKAAKGCKAKLLPSQDFFLTRRDLTIEGHNNAY